MAELSENVGQQLFVWTNICNLYVPRDSGAVLLINLGDGSVLDHLAEICVKGAPIGATTSRELGEVNFS